MAFKKIDDLLAFVKSEEAHIDWGKIINDTGKTSVACADKLLSTKAEQRFVGGVANLYLNNRLLSYVAAREGKGGVLEAHLGCGWLFARGYTTYEAQNAIIVAARRMVATLNKTYGASFQVPKPEHVGSAEPFMVRT